MAKRALVAICHNQPMLFTKTARSLMELGWGARVPYAKDKTGFESVAHAWYTASPRVDMLRNHAVSDAIRGHKNPKSGEWEPYTHLIFLDADMVWPTDVVFRLLEHADTGIVAGLYVLKGPPYGPVHLVDRHEENGVNMFHRANTFDSELVPVEVVGMGCTIIPVSVCQQMGTSDWFEYKNDADGWPRVSEDVPFCLKAGALGVGIYMDPKIRCGHVTTQVIDHRWHQRYQDSIEASKEMGPTVEVVDA